MVVKAAKQLQTRVIWGKSEKGVKGGGGGGKERYDDRSKISEDELKLTVKY